MQHRLPELFQDQAWPHPVSDLQCLQTHISWVILTGEFAYKIKKPVNFGFVDYETLEARKHYCQLEVACNQRYAPSCIWGSCRFTMRMADCGLAKSGNWTRATVKHLLSLR